MKYLCIGFALSIGWALGTIVVDILIHCIRKSEWVQTVWQKCTSGNSKTAKNEVNMKIGF